MACDIDHLVLTCRPNPFVPKEYLDPWWQRAGADIDAAFNMQKLYTLDPKRIYVFGGNDWPDKDGTETMVASRVGLTFPDVFTGTFTTCVYPYRPIRAGNGGMYEIGRTAPDPAHLTMDKTRPFVLGPDKDDPQQKLFFDSYKADGFRYLLTTPVTQEQFHYPNLQTGWIPGILKFMDASTAHLKLPTVTTTTAPK